MLTSCGSDGDSSVRQEARESLRDLPPGSVQPPAANVNSGASAVATSGVKHYTCPNNCEGSGGDAAGTCPVCGSAYAHNQAYHTAGGASNPTITPGAITPGAITPGSPPATSITPPTPAAATNAAGVYHYTCPDGHAGGAGAAGSCATCGKALAHNQAYHTN